jgi:hypothetical protein
LAQEGVLDDEVRFTSSQIRKHASSECACRWLGDFLEKVLERFDPEFTNLPDGLKHDVVSPISGQKFDLMRVEPESKEHASG